MGWFIFRLVSLTVGGIVDGILLIVNGMAVFLLVCDNCSGSMMSIVSRQKVLSCQDACIVAP